MEKLDKVIAGLECCTEERCKGCPYLEHEQYCMGVLGKDALEVLRRLREENRDLRRELAAGVLRGMPNDWGEYPPEFPREGM